MPKNYFKINWLVWAKMNLATILKNPILSSYIYSLLGGISSIHSTFLSKSDDIVYYLSHNGQVIYLEKVINEKFQAPNYDPNNHVATRTIFITDGNKILPKYLFLELEEKPTFLGVEYLNTQSEIDTDNIDFYVNFPNNYQPFDQNILDGLVNKYKLPGKTWKTKFI